VEFAAIQGLNVKVDRRNVAFEAELAENDAKIDAQQREIDELRSELNAVKRAVERLGKLCRTSQMDRHAA
jgi:septal ring factor EnvC (AmiA/AmiB activator)